MAQFYAGIQGSRGMATRLGGKESGIYAFAQGWSSGVKVHGHVTVSGEDEFTVYATEGSGGSGRELPLFTISNGRILLSDLALDIAKEPRPSYVSERS